MNVSFMKDFVIIFSVAIAINFVFHRLKIAPIVGYLIAGVLLGPSMLGVIRDAGMIEVMAEVGVILLLFLIGIEFSIEELAKISKIVFIGGYLQVFLTTVAVLLISFFFNIHFEKGIFIGLMVAMSSTAILFKQLSERGEMDSPHGRISAGILIFQDLSVVAVFLLLPVLSGNSNLSSFNIILNVLWAFAIVGFVIVISRFVIPILLYNIVKTHSRELFLISIVLICFGTAWLTSLVGLSLALGAFLAGLVISESEYAHQAFSEILPLRDIFSILFFVSIGLLLDVNSVINNPLFVLLGVFSILVIKFVIGAMIPVILGYPLRIGVLVGVALSQIGEFSFVLSKEGLNLGILSGDEYQVFLASAIITMILTPFMVQGSGRLSEYFDKLPILNSLKQGRLFTDVQKTEDMKKHVIVVGFGLNGRNVSRVLLASNIPFVVLELNPETVRIEKKRGIPILYGDASKESVLKNVNIENALSVVVAISDAAATRRIVELVRRLDPSVYIIARTRYTNEVNPLYSLGANDVIPEEFETSIEIISRVLHRYFIPVEEIEKHISELRKGGYEIFRNPPQKYSKFRDLGKHLPDIEIETMRIKEDSPFLGKTLAEIGFRNKYGVTVLAVQRGKETLVNPSGNIKLLSQDIVIFIGTGESLKSVFTTS